MASRRFPMKRRDLALALFVVSASAAPAAAHHPGADLDRVMGSKEKYFQLIDKPAPAFELMGAGENAVTLADFTDKIVVLHFVYASCPDVCPLHAEKLAEVQARSEEHTSELQSLMRISYAVFCLKKKNSNKTKITLILL